VDNQQAKKGSSVNDVLNKVSLGILLSVLAVPIAQIVGQAFPDEPAAGKTDLRLSGGVIHLSYR
jgi:hypothetical protein